MACDPADDEAGLIRAVTGHPDAIVPDPIRIVPAPMASHA
jgi:hypothetical protein